MKGLEHCSVKERVLLLVIGLVDLADEDMVVVKFAPEYGLSFFVSASKTRHMNSSAELPLDVVSVVAVLVELVVAVERAGVKLSGALGCSFDHTIFINLFLRYSLFMNFLQFFKLDLSNLLPVMKGFKFIT